MAKKDHYITPEALQIMQQFPELFGRGPWTTNKTLLGWGFSCGYGWYSIIERLCVNLAEIVREDHLDKFRVSQVKEKLGGLRFYVRHGNDRTGARILEAVGRLPLRLGDHALLQALLLLHLVLQANGPDEHATVSAALFDLTEASADRVPPTVYASLQRALKDVEEGYFPTVHPASDGTAAAPGF